MRVLLDACVPQDLRHVLGQHTTMTARYAGLAHLGNGKLLDAMAGQFDVLVTTDARLPYQQNIAGRPVAVVVFRAGGIRLKDLLPLVPALLDVLDDIRPGEVREVTG
jgi:predicted nuclease of predicted toxin-antitoxin system